MLLKSLVATPSVIKLSDGSNSESPFCPDVSNQVSGQSDMWLGRISFEEYKMTAMLLGHISIRMGSMVRYTGLVHA